MRGMRRASSSRRNASAAGQQLGLTIIELLIGVAVGLMVVVGAVKLMADTLGGNRRLLLEARVNQDLRVATDLIARDLRRAGYWRNATSGIFSTNGTGSVTLNPYTGIVLNTETANASDIQYQYAHDYNNSIEDAEQAGFRVRAGVLEFKHGADGWQKLTDPNVITVTNLSVAETSRLADLYTFCSCLTKLTCTAPQFQIVGGSPGTYYASRPRLTIRQYDVVLAGQSATDPSVVREIRETVRVRNDLMTGSCPSV